MVRRCRISRVEKQYFEIDTTEVISLNRRSFERHGPPYEDVSTANGDILYNADKETWKCQISTEAVWGMNVGNGKSHKF